MTVKVLYDSQTKRPRLKTGWGVSFLIGSHILFDAGEWGDWLLSNMRAMGLALSRLRAVVISHDHWDHTGGLWDVLDRRPGLTVYACPGFSREFKKKVKQHGGRLRLVKPFARIAPGVLTSGAMRFIYKGKRMTEQALIIKTGRGVSVLTGCAHPGIVPILKKARHRFPAERLHAVAGGFHLMDTGPAAVEDVAAAVYATRARIVAPLHCTGARAVNIFRKTGGARFRHIVAGARLGL